MINQPNNINSKIYCEYFREYLEIQDYFFQNPIYSESYYDCLNQMFAIITKKAGQTLKINNSDYTHKINKVYACIKSSKFTSSKLLREVRITKHGLIQQKFKSQNIYSEKVNINETLFLCVPEIVKTSEIKGKEYKMAFENQKQKSKWVYFDNYIDARKVRDFCYANAAINNLRYNLAGFIHILIKHFNETSIYFVLQKISKTRQEMERLSIIELNQSQTLSLFSPGLLAKQDYEMKQSLSFQENSIKTQGQDNQLNLFLQRVVNEYLDQVVQIEWRQQRQQQSQVQKSIQNKFKMRIQKTKMKMKFSQSHTFLFSNYGQIKIELTISDHHKSKYLDLNSSNQMYNS